MFTASCEGGARDRGSGAGEIEPCRRQNQIPPQRENTGSGKKFSGLSITGGVSYTDAWMWQRLPGATLSLQAGYRFKQGELLFELGYARNHIDVLSRLPLEDIEAVKLRVAVIAWL